MTGSLILVNKDITYWNVNSHTAERLATVYLSTVIVLLLLINELPGVEMTQAMPSVFQSKVIAHWKE